MGLAVILAIVVLTLAIIVTVLWLGVRALTRLVRFIRYSLTG